MATLFSASPFPPGTLALIAAVFTLAGFVKGAVGMGLPTVAMGLLGLFMAPVQAAALLLLPSFATNVWQLLAGPSLKAISRRLATMMVAILLGTIALAGLMGRGDGAQGRLALGLTLVVYALSALAGLRWRVRPAHERWLSPLIGAITGGVSAATGVFVVPAVAYLQSLGLDKDDLVQALGLSFTISTIGLAIGLGSHGHLGGALLGPSLLALLPSAIGMVLGTALRRRIRETTFRRGFLVGLALLGAHLAWSGI